MVLASRRQARLIAFDFVPTFHSTIISGLLPFAVISMEVYFILKSMWQEQYYYMFGFLVLVGVLLVVTVAEITIVCIYSSSKSCIVADCDVLAAVQ